MHQAGAGQSAVATYLGDPAQNTGAKDGAGHNRQQGLLGPHGRHQVSADLHDQQANAKTEPQRSMIAQSKDALAGRHRTERRIACVKRRGRVICKFCQCLLQAKICKLAQGACEQKGMRPGSHRCSNC